MKAGWALLVLGAVVGGVGGAGLPVLPRALAVETPSESEPEVGSLGVGAMERRRIAPAATLAFEAALVSGRAYLVSVEQRGVDVEVAATAPDDERAARPT